ARVEPRMAVTAPLVDLRGLPPRVREDRLRWLVESQARYPFDLTKGPLLRAVVVAVAGDDHALLLSLHHIVADGWSHAVLLREVSAQYAACAEGRSAALPELPLQYADYAEWQRRRLSDGRLREALDWWKDQLSGTGVLLLPTDHPRPTAPSFTGGSVQRRVRPDIVAALRALGRREGATLFMTLLAAFHTLLHRYSGQTDVTVGTPVAGRDHRALEDLIGCFVNTVALRLELDGDPPFLMLLRRAREGTLAAYAHQEVPFELVVDELGVERTSAHPPVCQVMFVMHNTPPLRWELPGLTARPVPAGPPEVHFDLSMVVLEDGDGLVVTLDYRSDLFEVATAGRMLDGYLTLLAAIAASPHQRIGDLPVLSPAAARQVLVDWGTATADRVRPSALASDAVGVPIGQPVSGIQAYVLDTSQRAVPAGATGELCLGGAQVGRGYFGRPALTAQRFVPDPFGPPGGRLYRTGDLARWTCEGVLEFVGRRDDQVKVRGHRIELGEVEATLAGHPGVSAVAVVASAWGTGDLRLAAHIVGAVTPADLLAFARARLPGPAVPAVVRLVDALPLTPNGKVDRARLATTTPVPPGAPEAPPGTAAVSPAVELLIGIWRDVLGTQGVDDGTDFFHAGGHSLLALQVLARVRQVFGAEPPVQALFAAPTPAGFAAYLAAGHGGPAASVLPPITPVGRSSTAPLSYAQRRLWYLDRILGGLPLHHVTLVLTVDGPLNVVALRRAFAGVMRQYEVLRTTFREHDSIPAQVVQAYGGGPAPLADLSALGEAAQGEAAQRLTDHAAARRFDLDRGPLVRVQLIRLTPYRHLVVVAMHHIITDAWSTGLLLDEIWQRYTAVLDGAPHPDEPPSIQYVDYAVWEQQWLAGPALDEEVDYWRQHLYGAPEGITLPYDHPRPMVPVFAAMTIPFELPPEQTRHVVQLGADEGVTPFMVLLAAFLIVLYDRSGQSDLVVGTDVANRGRLETERLLGFLTNQVVLRTRVVGQDTVRDVLTRVREVTLAASAHQEMPFDRLVEALRPPRRLDRPPLFQVQITYQRAHARPQCPAGLDIEVCELHPDVTTYDLSLHVVHTETVLRGGLTMNADVFAPATGRSITNQLRSLLEAMAARPDGRVDELAREAVQQDRRAATRDRAATARALFDRFMAPATAASDDHGGR
ncbi:MAG TPA: condensation domain-containing protein, partial [Streptosporangiaceae bacterium]|nr:condensation domain-containing protein [Streptosporangiaceae bacterium]